MMVPSGSQKYMAGSLAMWTYLMLIVESRKINALSLSLSLSLYMYNFKELNCMTAHDSLARACVW